MLLPLAIAAVTVTFAAPTGSAARTVRFHIRTAPSFYPARFPALHDAIRRLGG